MTKWIVSVALVSAAALTTLALGSGAHAEAPATFAADSGPAKVEVSAFPGEVQEAYGLFAARCSRCHTLARAINTNLSPESWKLYVKKMMSKPGSGISPDDGKTIYRFLAFYQGVKDKQAKH
jgi:hypothetical protein